MRKNDIVKSDYIFYLNMKELLCICDKLGITFDIYLCQNNKLIKSGYHDDKETIINNIKLFYDNKKPIITIYDNKIINFVEIKNLTANDYGLCLFWAI